MTEGWENEYGGEWDGEETVGWLTGGSDEEPQQQPAITAAQPPQAASPSPAPLTPAYLLDAPDGDHIYGTLSYNRRAKCWTVRAEPCVTELIARLFPQSVSRVRGEARFPLNRRTAGDLNWLMLRYPLAVAERDLPRWRDAMQSAREWAARRALAQRLPETAEPPQATFHGALMPFQKQGLGYLLRNERALLADEMGPWKDGAGHCAAGQHACVSGVSCGSSAFGAQLAAGAFTVFAPARRRARTCAARFNAL